MNVNTFPKYKDRIVQYVILYSLKYLMQFFDVHRREVNFRKPIRFIAEANKNVKNKIK